MQGVDWVVVLIYCSLSLLLGIVLTRKASAGIESYFTSERKLGWWLAGTSMAATAFSSDTPLLITGIVRRRGIWGNWEVWALAASTLFAVFFFSKLWKRTGVMTEVEFVEMRYSGRPAAFLRGFKALYWGVLYNSFVIGAWPVTGLTKVMQEAAGWNKIEAILFAMTLTAVYSALSGYWGVIITDFFQFFVAMAGAFLLAFYSVQAAGGMDAIVEKLAGTQKLALLPPLPEGGGAGELLASPFGWFLGLIFIQWWAWKNTDGGGIIVQRIVSCRNEKQAVLSTLWFNIAQYALRSWPWIVTALASLVLIPDLADHERAYPRLITLLLPAGLRGVMIASFFAAFMSTMSTHLNWGSSYFINDFYKRFIRRDAAEKHYVRAGRIVSLVLAALAAVVALFTESIGAVFTFILNLTAAIGPVYFLRWFWWRINPWSEITAMAASLPAIALKGLFFRACGLPQIPLLELIYMILAGALFWLPATLATSPASRDTLEQFCRKVRPPGFWGSWKIKGRSWVPELVLWVVSMAALGATTLGPLLWILKRRTEGGVLCVIAVAGWFFIARKLGGNSHPDDVIPAVDVDNLSGNSAR
jgi:SSS family transporter